MLQIYQENDLKDRLVTQGLEDGAVDQVVKQYGMERVGYILANTLRYKNYDGRFSHSNKEWAEQVGTPENNARIIKFRADWVVTSHSAVLDLQRSHWTSGTV